MPFLCHSSHTLSTGLPWGSSSHNFMALFWVTAAEELSISQNLIGGKRPNKRLGSHPVYFLSHDVTELPFSPSMVTPPHLSQPASLTPCRKAIQNGWLYLRIWFQSRNTLWILDCNWQRQNLAHDTRSIHVVYVTEYSWTRCILEKAAKAKSKGSVCSQQELRDAVLQVLTTPVFVPVSSRKMRPAGVGWHWGASGHPPSQSRAPSLLLCPGDSTYCSCCPHLPTRFCDPSASHQPFPGWVKYHQNACCLYCSSESISVKFMMMSKYTALILWMGKWRYRELQCFNNLRNECRFADSHFSDTGKPKEHQKQPKPPGCFTFYLFPVTSEKL